MEMEKYMKNSITGSIPSYLTIYKRIVGNKVKKEIK